MLEKIEIIKQRFDEVSDLIIQPDIISDQKRYILINKEYKDLKRILERGDIYKLLISNINEAQQIITDGSETEMVELAKSQLEEACALLSELALRRWAPLHMHVQVSASVLLPLSSYLHQTLENSTQPLSSSES